MAQPPSASSAAAAQRIGEAQRAAERAAQLSLHYKGNDVQILDLTGVTDMTDYFVLVSGTSDTHVRSMAEHLIEDLKKEGIGVYHVEGLPQGRWILLDFVDFVVHLFHPTLRSFYQLERLWSDARIIPVEPQGALK